jgi:hypothetical protein
LARFEREDIAQFEWKYDNSSPGEGHVFLGRDTVYGHQKVWFECWKDGKKHGMASFRVDELPAVIAALQKARKLSGT